MDFEMCKDRPCEACAVPFPDNTRATGSCGVPKLQTPASVYGHHDTPERSARASIQSPDVET